MGQISSLGYLVVEASSPSNWKTFAEDICGAMTHAKSDGDLAIRLDGLEQRILVTNGDRDDVVAVGWQLKTQEGLRQYVEELRGRGIDIRDGDQALRNKRRVEDIYFCEDGDGLRHELFCGPVYAASSVPFRSQSLTLSGFVTGDLGVGHFLHATTDYDRAVAFYRDTLRLHVSDYIRQPIPGEAPKEIEATFFHASAGRHHSVAAASIPTTKNVHHPTFSK